MWHVTRDRWHVTRDMWHVTCDTFGGVNILSKVQLPSSHRLWFMILWRYFRKRMTHSVNQLMNHEAVCRTAPATPGLSIIEVTHSWSSGRGRGMGVLIFWKNISFSKFLIWPSDLPRRRLSPKIAARWRYRLPSNNLTAHYNSQFFVSFHFNFWPGSPKMPLNVSELGLNIIQLISNLYVGVFL